MNLYGGCLELSVGGEIRVKASNIEPGSGNLDGTNGCLVFQKVRKNVAQAIGRPLGEVVKFGEKIFSDTGATGGNQRGSWGRGFFFKSYHRIRIIGIDFYDTKFSSFECITDILDCNRSLFF